MAQFIVRLGFVLVLLPASGIVLGQEPAADSATDPVVAARQVMNDFLTAFNARDEAGWADTLLFPHIRMASGEVMVYDDKTQFVASTDLDEFARANNWHHSEWDDIEVIQSGPHKVHFKVRFSRFNPEGERYATFDSLYVLQQVDGRWGIRARSSFAP